jgi:hypothetical protein
LSVAITLCALPTAYAVNPNDINLGVIRWDGWVGDAPTPGVGADFVGLQVEAAMSPNRYHYRVPFYGVETGTDSVQIRLDSQAKMDAEIAYAQDAGIGFWAFCFYPDGSGQDGARHLYQSSAVRTSLNFAYIIGVGGDNFDQFVVEFQKPHYQKVFGNRPLIFVFTFDGLPYDSSTILTLRSASQAAGAGNPYVVALGPDQYKASGWANYLGADAVSAYATAHGDSNHHAYWQLAALERQRWDSYNWQAWSNGRSIVPFVTTGWDPRPLIDTPATFVSYNSSNWTSPATASEIGQHLQRAIDWSAGHPGEATANVLLMYAWNEFAEGGWIAPTLYQGAARLDAIKNVLRDKPPADPNLRNVYRFYRGGSRPDRFFTLNYGEAIYGGYTQEGIGFVTYANPIDGSMYPLYRCNSGGHFVSAHANCEGFSNEGVYGYVSSIPRSGFTALYRFQRGYEHLATKNFAEGAGWNYEGVLGYVPN